MEEVIKKFKALDEADRNTLFWSSRSNTKLFELALEGLEFSKAYANDIKKLLENPHLGNGKKKKDEANAIQYLLSSVPPSILTGSARRSWPSSTKHTLKVQEKRRIILQTFNCLKQRKNIDKLVSLEMHQRPQFITTMNLINVAFEVC